MGNIVDTI